MINEAGNKAPLNRKKLLLLYIFLVLALILSMSACMTVEQPSETQPILESQSSEEPSEYSVASSKESAPPGDALQYVEISSGHKLLSWGDEYGSYSVDEIKINESPTEPIILHGYSFNIELILNGSLYIPSMHGKIIINGKELSTSDVELPFDDNEYIWIRFRDEYDIYEVEILKGLRTTDGKLTNNDIKFTLITRPQCTADLGLLYDNGEEDQLSLRLGAEMIGFAEAAPLMNTRDKKFLLHFNSDMDKASVEAAICNVKNELAAHVYRDDFKHIDENLAEPDYIFVWHDAKTLQIEMNGIQSSKFYSICLAGAKSLDGFIFDSFWCFRAIPIQEVYSWDISTGERHLLYSPENRICEPEVNQIVTDSFSVLEAKQRNYERFYTFNIDTKELIPSESIDILDDYETMIAPLNKNTDLIFDRKENALIKRDLSSGEKTILLHYEDIVDFPYRDIIHRVISSPDDSKLAILYDAERAKYHERRTLIVIDRNGSILQTTDNIYSTYFLDYIGENDITWIDEEKIFIPKTIGSEDIRTSIIFNIKTGTKEVLPYKLDKAVPYVGKDTKSLMFVGCEFKADAKDYFYVINGKRHDIFTDERQLSESYLEWERPYHMMFVDAKTILLSGKDKMIYYNISTGEKLEYASAIAFGLGKDGKVYYMTNPQPSLLQ